MKAIILLMIIMGNLYLPVSAASTWSDECFTCVGKWCTNPYVDTSLHCNPKCADLCVP